jgi:hypothetical protein
MDLYYQIREHNDLGNSFYSKGVKKWLKEFLH